MTEARIGVLKRAVRETLRTALMVSVIGVHAQEETEAIALERRGAAPWSLHVDAFAKQTLTDNGRLRAQGQTDAITEAGAGAGLRANTRRLSGFLDYSLSRVWHARASHRNRIKNALSALATSELIDDFFFVDARASIAQQSISAFGTQANEQDRAEDNYSESTSVAVSPHMRGRFGTRIDYSARLTHQIRHNSRTTASNTAATTALIALNGGAPDPLGWSADASRHVSDYSSGGRRETDRVRGVLRYAITHDLVVGSIVGYEANNYSSSEKKGAETWGAEATWSPSARTRFFATGERRFFGNSHAVSLTHRSPRTIWTLGDSQEISTRVTGRFHGDVRQTVDPDVQGGGVQAGDIVQMSDDPRVVSGFLASAATVRREQTLSVSVLGGANTLTVHGARTRTRRVDTLSTTIDELSVAGQISQRGLSAALTHRLSPSAAIQVSARHMRTTASRNFRPTELNSVEMDWTTQIGAKARLVVGVRRTAFEAPSSYRESLIFGLFRIQY